MKVGDVLIVSSRNDNTVPRCNVFRITGIYLGAYGQQNMIGLASVYLAHGTAHGKLVNEMLVPEELVKLADLFSKIE